VRAGLLRDDEPRTDPRARGACGEYGGERAGVGDPARGEHWHVDGVQDGGQQRQQRRLAAQVAACLRALDGDHVGAGLRVACRDFRQHLQRGIIVDFVVVCNDAAVP
jgi:hypothetical protein